MHVCTFACAYVYTVAYMYMHGHACIYMACMHVYMYVNTCMHVYTCFVVCMHTWMCTLTHYMQYLNPCICVYACIYIMSIRDRVGNAVCTVVYSISIHIIIATACVTSPSNRAQAPLVPTFCKVLTGTHSGSTHPRWFSSVALCQPRSLCCGSAVDAVPWTVYTSA